MRRFSLLISLAITSGGCASILQDADGDGFGVETDCDDTNVTINPDAEEIWYDGIDQNCDQADDYDQDADGISVEDDCDDLEAATGSKSNDEDCDGFVTEDDCDDTDPESTSLSEDADCDGVLTADDCDDTDPESTEISEDADCDGVLTADDCDDSDANLNNTDADGDGLSTCENDCDDTDPTVYPGAVERIGDAVDQDCSGLADSGTPVKVDFGATPSLIGPRLGESDEGLIVSAFVHDHLESGYTGVVEHLFDSLDPSAGPSFTTGFTMDAYEFYGLDLYDSSTLPGDSFHTFVLQDEFDGILYTTLVGMVRQGPIQDEAYSYVEYIFEGDVQVEDLHANNKSDRFAASFCTLSGSFLAWGSPSDFSLNAIDEASGALSGTVCAANAKNKRIHLVNPSDSAYTVYKDDKGELKEHDSRSVVPLDLDLVDNEGDDFAVGPLGEEGLYVRYSNQDLTLGASKVPVLARLDLVESLMLGVYLSEDGEVQLFWGDLDGFYEAPLDFGLQNIQDIDIHATSIGTVVVSAGNGETAHLMHLAL